VESRDFKLQKEAADINEIVEHAVERISSFANDKNIMIHLNLEPMFLVEFDSVLIHEVILNLIENALKYSPPNSNIFISSREVNDQVIVVIEDEGFGIAKEDQPRIFEKFYRSNQENSSIKGSGLGLYLVKYFIELHNGSIFLESAVGKGTKVTISLPTMDDSTALTDYNIGPSGDFKESV
jgi:signal transduction histidine kinase